MLMIHLAVILIKVSIEKRSTGILKLMYLLMKSLSNLKLWMMISL